MSLRVAYVPALDGLRAVCLLAVLFFHTGFPWMVGGFLGVSTFFTLSGFLITSLLLREVDGEGTLSVRRFWARRLRRLLPAGMLTTLVIVATAPFWLSPEQRERLAGDSIAALFYAVNWQFVRAEYAYEQIFTLPSPLQHFWSLAIEAQFYLVWPVLLVLLMRVARSERALLLAVVGLTLCSVGLGWGSSDADAMQYRLYYGTDARAGELLVGALLALLDRESAGWRGARTDRVLALAGAAALAALVGCWARVGVDTGALYRGGFALYAMLSAAVIAASVGPVGLVPRLLSATALRWIGKVSYGAYLYHWPVFLFLDAERTGLDPAPLVVLRVGTTLALAGISYRFFEEPIRRGRRLAPPWFGRVAVAGCLLIGAVAVATSPIGLGARLEALADGLSSPDAPVSGAARSYAIFGDSMAYTLLPGFAGWARQQPDARVVKGAPILGCGLELSGQARARGHWFDKTKPCRAAMAKWRVALEAGPPDVAVVLVGSWETRNWRRNATAPVVAMGDPAFDAEVRVAIGAAMDTLVESGAEVVWLTAPPLRQRDERDEGVAVLVDASRIDRLNELIREEAALRGSRVRVVDLAVALERWPGGPFDEALRPDGVHFLETGARDLVGGGLGAEIAGRPRTAE